jgi:hypothetical protein
MNTPDLKHQANKYWEGRERESIAEPKYSMFSSQYQCYCLSFFRKRKQPDQKQKLRPVASTYWVMQFKISYPKVNSLFEFHFDSSKQIETGSQHILGDAGQDKLFKIRSLFEFHFGSYPF